MTISDFLINRMKSGKEEVFKNRLQQNVALQDCDDKQGDENFHSQSFSNDDSIFNDSDNKVNKNHARDISDDLITFGDGLNGHDHHGHCCDDTRMPDHHRYRREENILDFDDDYVSEDGNSTTSTSTSRLSSPSATSSSSSTHDDSSTTATQQPDSTRVCDCCYCEVFGHGGPQVTPTSRNYHEMRDRLRMRLSKRQAARCQEGDTLQSGPLNMDESSTDRGGGGDGRLSCDSETPDHNPSTKNNGSANQSNKSNNLVADQRNLDELLDFINGTNSSRRSNNRRKDKNVKGSNKKCQPNGDKTNSTSTPNKARNSKVGNINQSRAQSIKDDHVFSPDCRAGQQRGASKSASKVQNQQPHGIDAKTGAKNQLTSAIKHQSTKSSAKNQPTSKISDQPSHQKRKATGGVRNEKERAKVKEMKSEQGLTSAGDCLDLENSAPTDVFMPRTDIDLNDVRLDELEREIEAFKRFCFESKTLVRKDRMQVRLKSNWIMP